MDEALRNMADFLHEIGELGHRDHIVDFIVNNWDKIEDDVYTYKTKD